MINQLVVFHKKTPNGREQIPQGVPLWSFGTCLRKLHFTTLEEGRRIPWDHDFETFKGHRAYEFLLEVMCGLHSPVIGETEVFGQFRKFWKELEKNCTLKPIFDQLVADVKVIRRHHLTNLGSQSYGSVIRRMLNKATDVAVIGGGSLAVDILPWIYKDENSVTVYLRDPSKGKSLQQKYPNVVIQEIGELISQEVAIVAAPVSSKTIEDALTQDSTMVMDLRGESRMDPCKKIKNYKDLDEFFQVIETNKEKILKAKAQALNTIREKTNERIHNENLRAQSWEGKCAL